ncbi:MAG: lipid-A-disaccharide synthase, partial [Bacteroidota bacterium]
IAAAPSVDKSFYEKFLENNNSKILYGKTYEILKHSCAAIVTSGTATLETALFNVPEIVCYRSGNISYHIAKRLIKVKYISLVNLIMEKAVVKELIQSDLNTRNLIDELEKLLHNELYRQEMFINYSELRRVLGGKGASCRVADLMYKYLNE